MCYFTLKFTLDSIGCHKKSLICILLSHYKGEHWTDSGIQDQTCHNTFFKLNFCNLNTCNYLLLYKRTISIISRQLKSTLFLSAESFCILYSLRRHSVKHLKPTYTKWANNQDRKLQPCSIGSLMKS